MSSARQDVKRNKRIDWTGRANGGSTSEIMDRNYPRPNPLAFDGVRHSRGVVFPAANRATDCAFKTFARDSLRWIANRHSCLRHNYLLRRDLSGRSSYTFLLHAIVQNRRRRFYEFASLRKGTRRLFKYTSTCSRIGFRYLALRHMALGFVISRICERTSRFQIAFVRYPR